MKLEVTCANPCCPYFLDKIEYFRDSVEIIYDKFVYNPLTHREEQIVMWKCPHCNSGYKWKMIKREDQGTDTPKG